ncbi:MAG: hypothetical protein ACLR3C_05675 [Eggerthella lenta]
MLTSSADLMAESALDSSKSLLAGEQAAAPPASLATAAAACAWAWAFAAACWPADLAW